MKLFTAIRNNIPNSITCLNLVSGALACIYALRGSEDFGGISGYQISFIMIAAAAVFDFCDGLDVIEHFHDGLPLSWDRVGLFFAFRSVP